MQISQIEPISQGSTVRAQALITREDSERPPFTMFIQTVDRGQEVFGADPNSFLMATILTAWQEGERRVHVDGVLCPLRVNNLEGVFMMLKAWYPEDFGKPPVIEASGGTESRLPSGLGAISLMSAGIDSLCLLRANRLFFPEGHPNYIRAVLPVAHVDKHADDEVSLWKNFEGRLTAIRPVSEDSGVDIYPACTNVWWLNPDGYFYGQKSYSSLLSAVTCMFGKGYQKGYIASSYDAAFSVKPWGSHPQLDAYYSTSYFSMENSGTEMTRFKKVRMLADWQVALNHMRVCQNDNSGGGNCGTCEKCIRTMLMLESMGKLKECTAFPQNHIDVDLVNYLSEYDMLYSSDPWHNEEKIYMYNMIITPLEDRGRNDLAVALREILKKLCERAGFIDKCNE
jgi:hypothetical protein